jgi:hypothetical protein
MNRFIAAGVVTASLLAGACASGSGRVYVRSGPPPLRAEAVLVSPGPGYVWIPGYYRNERGGYVWIGGHYERSPRARARWVPGHWENSRRGWYYVDGHWR